MSDLIERQAAIDALDEQIRQCDKALSAFSISMKDEYAVKAERASLMAFRETLEYMPSAQPPKEIPKRVLWSGWQGCRDTRYKCPNCERPVRNDDAYCHRCGQRLMFPKISFTDYVPGEKQDVIVRWDDEG